MLLSLVCYTGGEFGLKLWANHGLYRWAALAVFSYMIGTFCWLALMRVHNELARMGTIYAAITLITTIMIGLKMGEAMSVRQWIGAAFALLATVLLV
jgi:drug/metabolite transporter (DMT)-like permease